MLSKYLVVESKYEKLEGTAVYKCRILIKSKDIFILVTNAKKKVWVIILYSDYWEYLFYLFSIHMNYSSFVSQL